MIFYGHMKKHHPLPTITVENGKVHVGITLAMAALAILFSGSSVYAITGFGINNPAPFNTSGLTAPGATIPTTSPTANFATTPPTGGLVQTTTITNPQVNPATIAPTPTLTVNPPPAAPVSGFSATQITNPQPTANPTIQPIPDAVPTFNQAQPFGAAPVALPTDTAPSPTVYQAPISYAYVCPAPETRQTQIEQMVAQLYEQCIAWGRQCSNGNCSPDACEQKCSILAENDLALRTRCLQVMCEIRPTAVNQPVTQPEPTKSPIDCAADCKQRAAQAVTFAFDINQCLLECSGTVRPVNYSREVCLSICEEEARSCSLNGPNSADRAKLCNEQYQACASKC
jgi:hypothetical protein